MSGGIDSSVAAALLKKQGFNVMGVFMRFWAAPFEDRSMSRWNRCCSLEAERRARRVAAHLNIPFYVFNFEKEFKKRVVDYFLREYRIGRTPNPCVVCNKEIKFGFLLEKALAFGVNYVATGHYARKVKSKLLRAKDKEKDQSYFLWMLNQKQLKHILFPIGNYTKKEVRNLAKRFKLPILTAPESMEICFIRTTINDFLARYIKQKPGKIVCAPYEGAHLGRHQGLAFYTLGQRKGIGLPGGPYWVLDKDLKRNLLIVTKNEKDLYKKELVAENINWLSEKEPKLPLKVKAKIRYRSNLTSATICKNYKVIFNRPQRAITPGQSVVFYRGQELLGGGIIVKTRYCQDSRLTFC